MDIPTPKTEPVVFTEIVAIVVSVAARYGLKLDATAVLATLTVLSMIGTFIARRRTVAIHPSTGETVKTGVQVVAPN